MAKTRQKMQNSNKDKKQITQCYWGHAKKKVKRLKYGQATDTINERRKRKKANGIQFWSHSYLLQSLCHNILVFHMIQVLQHHSKRHKDKERARMQELCFYTFLINQIQSYTVKLGNRNYMEMCKHEPCGRRLHGPFSESLKIYYST